MTRGGMSSIAHDSVVVESMTKTGCPSGSAPEGSKTEVGRNHVDTQAPDITIWYTNACSIQSKWGELETRVRGADVLAKAES